MSRTVYTSLRSLSSRAAMRPSPSTWPGAARPAVTAEHVAIAGIRVDARLKDMVDTVIMPGKGVQADTFWRGFASIVHDLAPRNRAELDKRDKMQRQIDSYHRDRRGQDHDPAHYRSFLEGIGYIETPASADAVAVLTENVDREIASVAGPQLVCPVDNARFIVNACNARWGSLLDAFYGTDAVPGDRSGPYSEERGALVFAEAHAFLDRTFPLAEGVKWSNVEHLSISAAHGLAARVSGGAATVGLERPTQFLGYSGARDAASSLLLRHNGLHVSLEVDRDHPIGRTHRAGIKDVQVESALTAICDAEDSASAVDAEDKMRVYGNWHGLMTGTIAVPMTKNGKQVERRMAPDRTWRAPDGSSSVTLPGRALLLCRNVGLHMYTDVVTLEETGAAIPEHFLDAAITVLAAMHDVRSQGPLRNSRAPTPSVYVVKPKMHGPSEVALVDELFGRVETLLGLPANTVKLGVMDEERRASVNLPEMMRAARHRLCFINTGFLDRTGDEIHTDMEAGPMLPKADIKKAPWYNAYEDANVASGLLAGLVGRGQIGKGMWAAPDNMAQMVKEKVAHLTAGGTCAWVPSPTAATLHALHYHDVDVHAEQSRLRVSATDRATGEVLEELLKLPIAPRKTQFAPEVVKAELDNNCQGILGYVSRWVGQGVGCSKVPDLHGTQLMEDRATLRISSQHIANWLHHGIVTEAQVLEALKRMAALVDQQNASDPHYRRMTPTFDGPEWHAALDLIFCGRDAPNGYTEFTLTERRRERKTLDRSAP